MFERQWELVCDLPNTAIFNDLELTQISRACRYSMLNILETVQDRDNGILIGTYTRPTQQCNFE